MQLLCEWLLQSQHVLEVVVSFCHVFIHVMIPADPIGWWKNEKSLDISFEMCLLLVASFNSNTRICTPVSLVCCLISYALDLDVACCLSPEDPSDLPVAVPQSRKYCQQQSNMTDMFLLLCEQTTPYTCVVDVWVWDKHEEKHVSYCFSERRRWRRFP